MENGKEETSREIYRLKKELAEKEKNLTLAALYGKDLLNQNAELHTRLEETVKEYGDKLEELEQQKYSLSMKLESKGGEIRTLHSEIDLQESISQDSIQKISRENQEQVLQLNKKIFKYEVKVDSLQKESQIKEEQVQELQHLLEEAQRQQLHQTITMNHDASFEESTNMFQNQIVLLTSDKQNLENDLMGLRSAFKSCNLQLEKLERCLQIAQSELEEKECKLTSLFNAVEKLKEEKLELLMEIDNLKMTTADPRRKGNSLFAEVEDHRQALEKKVLTLTSSYNIMKKQYEIKTQQIAKMKLQIASLLCLSSSGADKEYQKNLEDCLASTKCQLDLFTRRCKELENQIQDQTEIPQNCQQILSSHGENNIVELFKDMYEDSQKKIKELQEEMKSMRFNKVALNDQILQLQRKLYRAEKEKDSTNGELIRLKVKLDELTSATTTTNKENGSDEKGRQKRVTEKLPVVNSCDLNILDDHEGVRFPLKERIIQVKKEVQQENSSSKEPSTEEKGNLVKNKENVCLKQSQNENKNKTKKCVTMLETVYVHEEDKVHNAELKEDAAKKLPKHKRSLKKMEGVHIQASNDNECKQQ